MQIQEPKPTDDVRDLWKVVRAIVRAINALSMMRVMSTGRNFFSWSEGNAVLEIAPGEGGDGADQVPLRLPWQPFLAPWTGTAANRPEDWGLSVMVRRGAVVGGLGVVWPSNPNQVFHVPPNCVQGFVIWAECIVDATGKILDYTLKGGTEVPAQVTVDASDQQDAPPPKCFFPLLVLTSNLTTVLLRETIYGTTTSLSLLPVVTNQGTFTERRMMWSPGTFLGNSFSLE